MVLFVSSVSLILIDDVVKVVYFLFFTMWNVL